MAADIDLLIDMGMIPRAESSDEPVIAQYLQEFTWRELLPKTNLIDRLMDIGYNVNAETDEPDRGDALFFAFCGR